MSYGYPFTKIVDQKIECNFILPLGKDCKPASYLKRFNLRFFRHFLIICAIIPKRQQ